MDRYDEDIFEAVAEIVAVSEGYKTKAACLKGIESVRRNAAAPTLE